MLSPEKVFFFGCNSLVWKTTLLIEVVRQTMSGYFSVATCHTSDDWSYWYFCCLVPQPTCSWKSDQAGPYLVLLLLLVLASLHTQTIRAVFLKYNQLYLLRATECISGTLLLLMLGSLDTETIWRPRATSSHQASNFSLSLSFFLPFSPLTFCVLKHANFAMRGNIIFWLSS